MDQIQRGKKGNKCLKGEKEMGKIRNRICYFVCAVFTLTTVFIWNA